MPFEVLEEKKIEPEEKVAEQTPASDKPVYKFGGKEYASVDDLGKAYESLQSEHGKWTSGYGDLKKQYEDVAGRYQQWEQWWNGVKPLWGQDVVDFLEKKYRGSNGQVQQPQQQAQQMQQQVQQVANQVAAQAADQYDFYRPEDVAKFKQAVSQDIARQFQGQLAQLAKSVNQTFIQKENLYQNYLSNHLSLLRRALEQKLQNPEFNVDAVMENAARAIGGQIDPIELGKKLIAAEQSNSLIEAAKKEAYALGKRDLEQEYKNKQENAPVPQFLGAPIPKFTLPVTPPGTRGGLHTLREKAAESLYKRFGPQVFRGE